MDPPSNVGISPIFNVYDLYSFERTGKFSDDESSSEVDQIIEWKKQLPKATPNRIEGLLDRKVVKKTKGKEYF